MKNLIITIGTVIIVASLAFWYLDSSTAPSGDGALSATQSADSGDAQFIYSLVQKMSAVQTLNDSIFNNPTFQSLKDNTVTFPMPTAGRANPFAPFGSTGAPISTTTVRIKK